VGDTQVTDEKTQTYLAERLARLDTAPVEEDVTFDVFPCGYHILLGIPTRAEQTRTGIFRPEDYRQKEQAASVVAQVIEVGPVAYLDRTHFPVSFWQRVWLFFGIRPPTWCKKGDFVLIHSYIGTRFVVHDAEFEEYKIVEDRHILAIVKQPEKVDRVNAA
jgi:co-chaperonin GroES (HSP10)